MGTISYEVRLALILIFYLVIGILLISCIAETNRTPFDFAEGESELVSGFNIEYGRVGFALIFIAEYASIIFIRVVFSLMFFSSRTNNLYFYLLITSLVIVWIWVRTTFPRYRYDKLINLAWKIYLPITLF